MKKIIKWIGSFIVKHHKCENNMKITSTLERNGILEEVEYECFICGKRKVVKTVWFFK